MGSRFSRDPAPGGYDGELLTVEQVNDRLRRLADALTESQPGLERLLAEQATVDLAYALRYAAVVKTSKAGSEDRRKAEGEIALSSEVLDDSTEDLATRKITLAMRVRAQREAQHNIRAQISAMQTLSANLRAEQQVLGVRT